MHVGRKVYWKKLMRITKYVHNIMLELFIKSFYQSRKPAFYMTLDACRYYEFFLVEIKHSTLSIIFSLLNRKH